MSNTKTATLGFTIENRAGIDVLVWEAGGCQPATSAEVAMWKALAAVQQPVVREPLTEEQMRTMRKKHPAEDLCGWSYRMGIADAEAHHGITQKGGS